MYNIHNPVLPDGVIHHVNGNKLDNRIENLEGMTKKQHKTLHGKELILLGKYIKTRTHVKNQFGVFEIKKRNLVKQEHQNTLNESVKFIQIDENKTTQNSSIILQKELDKWKNLL